MLDSEVEALIEEVLDELGVHNESKRQYYRGYLFTKYCVLLHKTPDEMLKEAFKTEVKTHRFLETRWYAIA